MDALGSGEKAANDIIPPVQVTRRLLKMHAYCTGISFHGNDIGDAPFKFSFSLHLQPPDQNSKTKLKQSLGIIHKKWSIKMHLPFYMEYCPPGQRRSDGKIER